MAGREHAIGVAIAAIARQAHVVLDAAEGRAVRSFISSGLVVNRIASDKRRAGAHLQVAVSGRPAIMRGRRRRR